MTRRRRVGGGRGFTLIELLVVIALLMAILMPVLGRVRREAQSLSCRSNVRQWGLGFQTYAAANDGKLPISQTQLSTSEELAIDDERRIFVAFYEQLVGRVDYNDLLLCPAAKRRVNSDVSSGVVCWTGSDYLGVKSSYGHNPCVTAYRGSWHASPYPSWRTFFWQTAAVKEAARVPVFFDCLWWQCPGIGNLSGYLLNTGPSSDCRDGFGFPPEREGVRAGWSSASFVCINRHEGGINMAFFDGSARKVGLKELWTLKWHKKYSTANEWTKAGGVQPEDWPEWMRKFKDY